NPQLIIPSMHALVPQGVSYADTVPTTLDLEERAAAYLQGITSSLMPPNVGFYAPPGHIQLFGTPELLTDSGGAANWGESVQVMILARRMSGFDLNNAQGTLAIQLASTRNMLDSHVEAALLNGGDGGWIYNLIPANPLTVAGEALMELLKQYPSPDLE